MENDTLNMKALCCKQLVMGAISIQLTLTYVHDNMAYAGVEKVVCLARNSFY